ncbi:HIG1 domain member 1A, mitochondrial [Tyrophagus putrescentiae]|nr:HIG1 domain member 1A, mitochondrial [Tyrophagus putrescentiae]
MSSMSTNQGPPLFAPGTAATTSSSSVEGENRFLRKIKESPFLPPLWAFWASADIASTRPPAIRGGQKLSFFLIHTRLAAQGFAVAVLGSLVLYSLGERAYNRVVLGKKPEE